jgi:hypothetical protein
MPLLTSRSDAEFPALESIEPTNQPLPHRCSV